MAMRITTKGAGIFESNGIFNDDQNNIINRLMMPIMEARTSKFERNVGKFLIKSNGVIPFIITGFSPSNMGICFKIIIIPIAASIPCMAESGNTSVYFPNLVSPKMI